MPTASSERGFGFRKAKRYNDCPENQIFDMRHQNALALCLLVISAVSLLVIPWWAALLLFLICYCVAGVITLKVAVGKVGRCKGFSRERARMLYRAAITRNL